MLFVQTRPSSQASPLSRGLRYDISVHENYMLNKIFLRSTTCQECAQIKARTVFHSMQI